MPDVEVPAEKQRELDLIAEVARRREALAVEGKVPKARRRDKSDAIFRRFDADADGYLNLAELRALGAATGGEVTELMYGAVCQEIGADAARGVSIDGLWTLYTDAGMGDVSRDHNLVFR